MKKFDIFDAMMKMQTLRVIIPEKNKIAFKILMERYINKVVLDYKTKYIIIEDGLYFDKVLQEYLDPDEIIETALFEAWDKKNYPKTQMKIRRLLENQEIVDFTEQLNEAIKFPVLKIKQKLF